MSDEQTQAQETQEAKAEAFELPHKGLSAQLGELVLFLVPSPSYGYSFPVWARNESDAVEIVEVHTGQRAGKASYAKHRPAPGVPYLVQVPVVQMTEEQLKQAHPKDAKAAELRSNVNFICKG